MDSTCEILTRSASEGPSCRFPRSRFGLVSVLARIAAPRTRLFAPRSRENRGSPQRALAR